MKNILTTIVLFALSAIAACAQSININHSGIQTTYDAIDVNSFNFNSGGAILNVSRESGDPLTLRTSDITSMESSMEPADFFTKYVDGEPAQVVFSCIEVNNTNPLQTQNFRLGKSNKYLFDAVILFSSNVNFSKRDNEVYIHNNDNVQAILNNWDHYIKPLKEKGIKVLLSLLGNHDGSGLANMSDERCRLFAQAIADTLDKYQLDGVFLDDEYSEYNKDLAAQGFEGFQNRGSAACASRLAYETKKAIGDRWVVPYKYGAFYSLNEVDGVKPGEYIDYVLTDYGVIGTWSSNESAYPGTTPRQYGICSVNMGGYTNMTFLKRSRTEKYGALMIYNLDQANGNYGYIYEDTLIKIAKNLFDDTLEVDPTIYKKDWKPVDGLGTPNRP